MSFGTSSIVRRPTWRKAGAYPTHARSMHFLPQALVATGTVIMAPALLVWWLRAAGILSALIPLVATGVGTSLAVTWILGAAWARRSKPDDLLFSELLLWGWVRRWRNERQLADGRMMLDRILRDDNLVPVPRRSAVLLQVVAALEAQDTYLDGHSRRVARHAAVLADRMGLPRTEVERIRAAAAVHDVGKLRIPQEVLDKPAALTDDEFELVKRHPEEGAAMVSCLQDTEITRIVRHHHERLDGKGYPEGLSGAEIPLGARIIAVVDTFDAITSARPYRPAASHRQAIETLRGAAGSQLDRDAVEVFVRCYAGRRAVIFWAAVIGTLQRVLGTPGSASAATMSAGPVRLIPLTGTMLSVGVAVTGLMAALPGNPLFPGSLPAGPQAAMAASMTPPANLSTPDSTTPAKLAGRTAERGLAGHSASAGPPRGAHGRRGVSRSHASGPGAHPGSIQNPHSGVAHSAGPVLAPSSQSTPRSEPATTSTGSSSTRPAPSTLGPSLTGSASSTSGSSSAGTAPSTSGSSSAGTTPSTSGSSSAWTSPSTSGSPSSTGSGSSTTSPTTQTSGGGDTSSSSSGGRGHRGGHTPATAPGHDGAAPGHGGAAPPGLIGATPGQSGTAGNSSNAQSGNASSSNGHGRG